MYKAVNANERAWNKKDRRERQRQKSEWIRRRRMIRPHVNYIIAQSFLSSKTTTIYSNSQRIQRRNGNPATPPSSPRSSLTSSMGKLSFRSKCAICPIFLLFGSPLWPNWAAEWWRRPPSCDVRADARSCLQLTGGHCHRRKVESKNCSKWFLAGANAIALTGRPSTLLWTISMADWWRSKRMNSKLAAN